MSAWFNSIQNSNKFNQDGINLHTHDFQKLKMKARENNLWDHEFSWDPKKKKLGGHWPWIFFTFFWSWILEIIVSNKSSKSSEIRKTPQNCFHFLHSKSLAKIQKTTPVYIRDQTKLQFSNTIFSLGTKLFFALGFFFYNCGVQVTLPHHN